MPGVAEPGDATHNCLRGLLIREIIVRRVRRRSRTGSSRNFKKNCTQKLGQPDKFGCSIADTLMRMDMGAVVRGTGVTVGGIYVPGVPSPNAIHVGTLPEEAGSARRWDASSRPIAPGARTGA